jgi:hypothetical protein
MLREGAGARVVEQTSNSEITTKLGGTFASRGGKNLRGAMMKPLGQFDGSLQMFVQAADGIDMRRLSFLRWLAEEGKLEHAVAGPPSGPLCIGATRREDQGKTEGL